MPSSKALFDSSKILDLGNTVSASRVKEAFEANFRLSEDTEFELLKYLTDWSDS